MRKRIEVAAAVLERPDGSYLLARRGPGTVYAGYWEFPGGKIEQGETGQQAILRELDEELGIKVERADPWLYRRHHYEHADVNLNFYRVRAWQGELQDRVHDALSWQQPGDEAVTPMLPANGPVLASLRLPPHYAITHAGEIGVDRQLQRLQQALVGGLRLVLLREPLLDASARHLFFSSAIAACHAAGARVLVHGDVRLATEHGADGVHLPARQLQAQAKRPDLPLVAASCHTPVELRRAGDLGCDFMVYGPVQTTASHPGQPGLGWDAFAQQVAVPPAPTYALGGLSPADLDLARRHGAQGVAGIRAFWADGGD